MAMLENMKVRLGIQEADHSQDNLITLVIDDAQAFFRDYCHRQDIPPEAGALIERLVLLFYERQQTGFKQGESMGKYNATYFVLNDEIPKGIYAQLARYRKMATL